MYFPSERWNALRAEYLSYQRRLQALYDTDAAAATRSTNDRSNVRKDAIRRAQDPRWGSRATDDPDDGVRTGEGEQSRAEKVDRWEHKPLSPEPHDRRRRRRALVEEVNQESEFPEGTVVYVKGLSPSTGRRALRQLADSLVQGTGEVGYVDLEKGLDAVSSGICIVCFLLC
jgi:hypothetical protein